MRHTVPIVFAFDNNLIMPAGVALYSLLRNAREDTFYDMFILHSAKSDLDRSALKQLEDRFDNFRIQYRDVGDTFDGAFQIRGINTVTYYRLLIPQLIPEYDTILYSDVDVIFQEDLRSLYETTDLSDCYIAGVNSLAHLHPDSDTYYASQLKLDSRHIVYAGNIILNAKKIREDGLTAQFLKEAENNYKFQDLDILNIVCRGRIKEIGMSFCATNKIAELMATSRAELLNYWTEQEIEHTIRSGLIHYNGLKPWKGICINHDIWWEYYRQSPYFDYNFYYDYYLRRMNELDGLSLSKRLKVLFRFFTVGQTK